MKSFDEFYFQEQIDESIAKTLGSLAVAGALALSPSHLKASETHHNQPSVQHQTNFFNVAIPDYIVKHEGIRNTVYKDSKGYKTIGIGHLLVPSDEALFKNLSLNYNKISNGSQKLSDRDIKIIFQMDLQKCVTHAFLRYKEFNNFSEMQKAAILDSMFRGEKHPKTDLLINQGKWEEAAKEYLNNDEYRNAKTSKSGVAKRMEENAKNLTQ